MRRGTSTKTLASIELWLADTFCWKATFSCPCRLVLPLCLVSYRSMHYPAPVSHSPSLCGCYLLKMADRKSLIPSDIQCSSYLVYHTGSHLSWTYINNYTAPVLLIIVVSAQRCVFCHCQEMRDWNELNSFLSCFQQPWSQIQHMLDTDQTDRGVLSYVQGHVWLCSSWPTSHMRTNGIQFTCDRRISQNIYNPFCFTPGVLLHWRDLSNALPYWQRCIRLRFKQQPLCCEVQPFVRYRDTEQLIQAHAISQQLLF